MTSIWIAFTMRSLWFSLPVAQVPRDTADIIEGGQIASEAVAESWNQLWDSVLQGGCTLPWRESACFLPWRPYCFS
jgi:hypothetical protein